MNSEAKCQVCRMTYKLTKQGVIRKHGDCPGSNQLPLPDVSVVVNILRDRIKREGVNEAARMIDVIRLATILHDDKTVVEMDSTRAWLERMLRDLGTLFYYANTLDKYSHCRICGGKVSDEEYRYAADKFQSPIHMDNEKGELSCYKKEIIKQHACCDKAEFLNCVCTHSFKCDIHGETHIGTHD